MTINAEAFRDAIKNRILGREREAWSCNCGCISNKKAKVIDVKWDGSEPDAHAVMSSYEDVPDDRIEASKKNMPPWFFWSVVYKDLDGKIYGVLGFDDHLKEEEIAELWHEHGGIEWKKPQPEKPKCPICGEQTLESAKTENGPFVMYFNRCTNCRYDAGDARLTSCKSCGRSTLAVTGEKCRCGGTFR